MLDEIVISKSIIESYNQKLTAVLDVDVAIAGAGPSGLVCAYYLASKGVKVVIFERKLSLGGGMWAGGMLFNEIAIQAEAKKILDDFGIRTKKYAKDYYVADAVEAICSLGYNAVHKGAVVMNGISVEDVMVKKKKVCGLVINWSAVELGGLHVDPLTIKAKIVVDSTGHPCEVAKVLQNKSGLKLKTQTGRILGEKSMWAEVAEKEVINNTREVCPNFYVCGMAANAVFGTPRMGPVFGGMLLSGKKLSGIIYRRLKK